MPGVELIGVPSSAGAHGPGQEQAPAALRAAGLVERLRARGLDVVDAGDLSRVTFSPDPEHPQQQSLGRVVEVAREVADRVDGAAARRRWPLVLGGDCTLSLGVMAGLLRHHPRLGVAYFDGDLDLNTPETTPSGIFDGMVLAHALGRGAPALAGIGPRTPMLDEEDVVLFGYDTAAGSIDPPELAALERSRLARHPLESLRADPAAAARQARAQLESRCPVFLVHFDVDVTDCPAADVPHASGLDVTAAFAALRVFLEAPACAGLAVTELNPQRDRTGTQSARISEALAEALSVRAGS